MTATPHPESRVATLQAVPSVLNSWPRCSAAVDVTERKKSEDALADAAEQLRLADQKKNEFLATLSHDLRNPLAPIRTALHILKRSAVDDADLQRYRSMMEGKIEQPVRLIDDARRRTASV